MNKPLEITVRLALLITSIAVTVLICEAAFRLFVPTPNDGYYPWTPNLHRILRPSSEIMPGVSGESRLIANSRGVRGDELLADHTYRILTIGGSTTLCLYLDQYETWPYVLQEKLNRNIRQHNVWVGNIAKDGLNTREHTIQMKYFVPQIADIDAIVMLLGVNDLYLRLRQDNSYDPYYLDRPGSEDWLIYRCFYLDPKDPFYKKMALWQILRNIKNWIYLREYSQDEVGEIHNTWRQRRRDAIKIRDTLPDLTSALDEFSRNLNTIIDMAEGMSIRMIFLTQPVLWKPNLSEDLQQLLWNGGVGDYVSEDVNEYYAVEPLAKAMDMYNTTLLRICEERQIECIDLASALPKDTTVFYDDFHFNERGAEKVAEIISQYMLRHEPFINIENYAQH